jgi:hypothetical protein
MREVGGHDGNYLRRIDCGRRWRWSAQGKEGEDEGRRRRRWWRWRHAGGEVHDHVHEIVRRFDRL